MFTFVFISYILIHALKTWTRKHELGSSVHIHIHAHIHMHSWAQPDIRQLVAKVIPERGHAGLRSRLRRSITDILYGVCVWRGGGSTSSSWLTVIVLCSLLPFPCALHANRQEKAKHRLSGWLAVKCWISFTKLSACHSHRQDFVDLAWWQVTYSVTHLLCQTGSVNFAFQIPPWIFQTVSFSAADY